jgi:MFS family permease
MGLVGAAFGLGLITGPAIGGISSGLNLLTRHPSLARFGVNPYSVPALFALGLCFLNLAWIAAFFRETLPPEARSAVREARVRNPIREILLLDNANARRANIVAFVYSVAFVAMESCLTYLAAQRFGYTAGQNTCLLCFLGFVSIFTQGYLVRKLLKTIDEIPVLKGGLILSFAGLCGIGFASQPWMLYASLAVVSMGFGLVNTSTSGLISLYASPAEQGRVLGIFRSLGSLSRAITPVLAGIVFWAFSSRTVFVAGGFMALGALALSARLPKPAK